MEGLANLVTESLARHNFATVVDHRRLRWSAWFRCESCFSFESVPDKPGIFALAEEVIAPGETAATSGKRMLAIHRVAEADVLGLTMGRLFLPGTELSRNLAAGRTFARYAVIEDDSQRQLVYSALQQWMASSSAVTSAGEPILPASSEKIEAEADSSPPAIEKPAPLPSGF